MIDRAISLPWRVLVAGGGVAALEAVLALEALAGDRVAPTLLTTATDYAPRPLAVQEAFGYATASRYAIRQILGPRIEHIHEDLSSVDVDRRVVTTSRGSTERFDALVVALGARPTVRYPHAITIQERELHELVRRTLDDIAAGSVRSIAFVAPERMPWPLALYEFALLTATSARALAVELEVTVVTPEDRPLEMFGSIVAERVATLLADRGVELRTSAYAEVPQRREIVISPGDRRVSVDRVIALPELHGGDLPGVPHDQAGFIPIDERCAVIDAPRVHAVGDIAAYPIKHGGVAAQMAVTAARTIAARVGAAVDPAPFEPELRGLLFTGTGTRYLRAHRVGGHAFDSRCSEHPLWANPAKITTAYLSPRLAAIEQSATA